MGENSRLKSLIWKVQSFWKMVITNTLLKTLNKLLETKILTEFQHSNFKLDRTWAPWFLLYGDSHLIKFEILGPTLYKLAIKLEYKLEKGIETITWYLFEVWTRNFEAQWNLNSIKYELVKALHLHLDHFILNILVCLYLSSDCLKTISTFNRWMHKTISDSQPCNSGLQNRKRWPE